jgi:hypothetical protein
MEEKKCFPSAKQNGAAGLFLLDSHQIPAEPCKIGSELRKEAEGLAWNKDLCSHFTRDMYEPEFFHLQN